MHAQVKFLLNLLSSQRSNPAVGGQIPGQGNLLAGLGGTTQAEVLLVAQLVVQVGQDDKVLGVLPLFLNPRQLHKYTPGETLTEKNLLSQVSCTSRHKTIPSPDCRSSDPSATFR